MRCARASRPGATGSRRRTTTSAAALSTTRRRSRRGPTTSPSRGPSETSSAVDPAARTVDLRRTVTEPHPRAIVPLNWVRDDRPTRTRSYELGSGSPITGSRRPDRLAPAATCCSGCRPGSASGSTNAAPAGRDRDLEAARRLAVALDHTTLADPGPARLGQDLHRRADDRARCWLPASGSAITGTSHKVIGNLLPRSLEARGRGRRRAAGPEGRRRTQVLDDRRVTAAEDATATFGRASTTDGRTSLPGRPGCGRRRRWSSRSTSCSSTRPARCRSPTSSRWPVPRQPRPARRSAAARPATPGTHPPGADRSALGARPRRRGDDARAPGALPRARPGGCIRTCAPSRREVFYDGRLEPEPHLARQRVSADPATSLDGTGPRLLERARRSGADNESPGRGRGGGGPRPRDRRGRDDLAGSTGRHASRRLGGRPDRGARTTPRSARSGAGCRRTLASARSTSSRARRRRSASTR